MRKNTKKAVIFLGLVLVGTSGGCSEWVRSENQIMDVLLLMVGAGPTSKTPVEKIETEITVEVSGSVGGLDGTYDFDFNDPEGGTFGSIAGTTKVKDGKPRQAELGRISITDKGSEDLISTLQSIAGKLVGGDVTITKAKGKIKGSQFISPFSGDINSTFQFSSTFRGTVTSGPMLGATIKKGKIGAEDSFYVE
jgi:hypothetical protein